MIRISLISFVGEFSVNRIFGVSIPDLSIGHQQNVKVSSN